jgi:hypothetical protein
MPTIRYNFQPFNNLEGLEKDSVIDVIGVVHSVGDVAELVSKTTQKPVLLFLTCPLIQFCNRCFISLQNVTLLWWIIHNIKSD